MVRKKKESSNCCIECGGWKKNWSAIWTKCFKLYLSYADWYDNSTRREMVRKTLRDALGKRY